MGAGEMANPGLTISQFQVSNQHLRFGCGNFGIQDQQFHTASFARHPWYKRIQDQQFTFKQPVYSRYIAYSIYCLATLDTVEQIRVTYTAAYTTNKYKWPVDSRARAKQTNVQIHGSVTYTTTALHGKRISTSWNHVRSPPGFDASQPKM